MAKFLLASLACLVGVALAGRRVADGTALDDYVWTPDSHYDWHDTGLRLNGSNLDGSVTWEGKLINMTSQQWLTPEQVSRSIWWHVLLVIEPSNADPADDVGMLWVTGGSNDGNPFDVDGSDEDVVVSSILAMESGMRVAALYQVPNVHITFAADPTQANRGENAIMAFGWSQFLDNPDQPELVAMLPMVKSAVAALDTLEEIWGTSNFMVSGASKRGWVTWLTAATDDRIIAMAPVVMDALGFKDFLKRMYRAYDGGITFVLEDFWDMNITARVDEPAFEALTDLIDPINYISRLEGIPKVMCDSGGDEFFMEDDARFWWDQLPEPKWSIYVANSEHSLVTALGVLLPNIGSFMRATRFQETMPTLSWSINATTGDITAVAEPKPDKVVVWSSRSCGHGPGEGGLKNRRDFRLATWDKPCLCGVPVGDLCIGAKTWWSSEELEPQADGTYLAHMDDRGDGLWTAFMIDAQWEDRAWPRLSQRSFEFSSGVSIVPIDQYPAEECHGEGCKGVLV